MYEKITPENVLMFAIRNYDNPHCEGEKEFEDDLKRFKYIKRLLTRYKDTDLLSVNLILNHLIVIFNVFGYEAGLKLLEYKLPSDISWSVIKPFLIYLKVIENDKYTGIPMNDDVIQALRKI